MQTTPSTDARWEAIPGPLRVIASHNNNNKHQSDKLDQEPDPDPHKFADDKPKWMEYECIWTFFSGVWVLIWKLGSGSGSALGWKVGFGSASKEKSRSGSALNKNQNPDPDPHSDPHQSDVDIQQCLESTEQKNFFIKLKKQPTSLDFRNAVQNKTIY